MSRPLGRLFFALVVIFTLVTMAQAAQPYDETSFEDAQAAGKTILIDVTAPWCPTCRRQQPTLRAVEKERPKLVVYEVDFDSAKDVLRRLHVSMQSTLIVFKGRNEVARSTGVTDPNKVRALVAKGF